MLAHVIAGPLSPGVVLIINLVVQISHQMLIVSKRNFLPYQTNLQEVITNLYGSDLGL